MTHSSAARAPRILSTRPNGNIMNCIRAALFCSLIAAASLAAAPAEPQPKLNCAVIGVKNAEGVSVGEADIIADRLRLELFNTGRASLMERDQMQDVLKEQGFQQSGACADEACMVEIGKVLGVELLVSGSIGKLGKMYLLNFRTIDVSTARIGAVVSRDITGSIEDVVWYLPAIAQELMGAAPVKTVVPVKAAVETPAEPPVVETRPVTTKVETVTDDPSGINTNRGGFRFQMSMLMPGMLELAIKGDLDTGSGTVVETAPDIFKTQRSTFINPHFRGMIKAGPVMTIDIGGGYYHYAPKYFFDNTNYVQMNYNIPSFGFGLNFNKRVSPIKINAGILMDLGLAILTANTNNAYGSSDLDFASAGLFLSPGVRVGIELLASPKVGFNFDAIWRYNHCSAVHTDYSSDSYGSGSGSTETTYTLAGGTFGVGVGICLYRGR